MLRANDERTPLLAAVTSAPLAEAGEAEYAAERAHHGEPPEEDDEEPLDLTQIFLLCYTRLVEPIAFFGIFPYINSMIETTGGVAKEDVGFHSGLIESLFSATQMCVMIFWGRVSKPSTMAVNVLQAANIVRLLIVLAESQSSPYPSGV